MLPAGAAPLPNRGPVHSFGWADYRCIAFNKLFLPIFVYHTFRFVWLSPRILWSRGIGGEAGLTLLNTLGALIWYLPWE